MYICVISNYGLSYNKIVKPCSRLSTARGYRADKNDVAWTVLFNRLSDLVEIHARARFHQAKCSGLRFIVVTERQ